MKKNIVFVFSLLLLSSALYAGHHEKDPIIFYLDLDIAEGKAEGVKEFIDYLVTTVEKTEPKTMYYKYWISADQKKVSLMLYLRILICIKKQRVNSNLFSPKRILKSFRFLEPLKT